MKANKPRFPQISIIWVKALILVAVPLSFLIISFSYDYGSADTADSEDMAFVESGCFMMGNDYGEENAKPEHEVCLYNFFIDKHEVTQADYERVMKKNPSHFERSILPVNNVEWKDAVHYCGKLNKRLPTEAEWEYAARDRGKKTRWSGTDKTADAELYGWFRINAGSSPHPVGEKKPNELGIFDLSGNLWEWVHDEYKKHYYKESPKMNPQGPVTDKDSVQTRFGYDNFSSYAQEVLPEYVYRGGAFNENHEKVTVYFRDGRKLGSAYIGFRCARSAKETDAVKQEEGARNSLSDEQKDLLERIRKIK